MVTRALRDRARRPRSGKPGFFSSARTLSLPRGPRIEPGRVGGYYIDLRQKARTPRLPPSGPPAGDDRLYVGVIQRGLGSYERYLAGEGEAWLATALAVAEHLLGRQERGGRHDGGWVERRPFRHTFPLRPPWLSAMAQGEGASLLVRMHNETREERFADAAHRALKPLAVPSSEGGVRAELDGGPFPEEYPTDPPSYVLNGAMFALWGCYDVGVGLRDAESAQAFEEGVDTLAACLDRWDTGHWSRYDLFPHPMVNVASSFYHSLHVNQLEAMSLIASRPQFESTAARFAAYAESRTKRTRALLHKVLFRLAVPRNKLLAHRMPWLRG